MGPEKTHALILNLFPYRESSYILHIVTPDHGRMHGIAKGIRRNKKGDNFLERGFLIECLLYIRPQRTLHTMGAIQIADFFPGIRTSLVRSAQRDLAFEVVLAVVHDSDPHPGLFQRISAFAGMLETTPEHECHPAYLWRFLIDVTAILGIRPNLDKCALCGVPLTGMGGRLNIRVGGIECGGCVRRSGAVENMTPAARLWLAAGSSEPPLMTPRDSLALTRLLADYCRFHCDVATEFQALAFLESTLSGLGSAPVASGRRCDA
jgi:DNA repair protein RecO (recombination protein O)